MTRYELLDRIGVGGMAEIFRGKAVAAGGFEKPVAIKRILPHLSQDRRFVELLIAEAKVLSLLKHRNIVQIFDVGLGDDGQYFLVMEYVDGKDIGAVQRALEAKRRRIPFDLALHIGAEICEALEHAHVSRGPDGRPMSLVHRDVSPSNVLLSRAGEVKLTDFGIAKRADSDATHGGGVRGKFAYISPEQARNEPLDPRSDVFSVGILMWELICNRRLYSNLDDLAALRAVREANVPRPTELDPRLPPELDQLLLGALAKDKTHRFSGCGELGKKLRSLRYSLEDTVGDPATELAKIIESTEELERQSATHIAARPSGRFEFDGAEATVIRIHTADAFSARDNDQSIVRARKVIDRFEEEETRQAQLTGDQLRMLRGARLDSDELPKKPSRGRNPRDSEEEMTRARPPMDFAAGDMDMLKSDFDATELDKDGSFARALDKDSFARTVDKDAFGSLDDVPNQHVTPAEDTRIVARSRDRRTPRPLPGVKPLGSSDARPRDKRSSTAPPPLPARPRGATPGPPLSPSSPPNVLPPTPPPLGAPPPVAMQSAPSPYQLSTPLPQQGQPYQLSTPVPQQGQPYQLSTPVPQQNPYPSQPVQGPYGQPPATSYPGWGQSIAPQIPPRDATPTAQDTFDRPVYPQRPSMPQVAGFQQPRKQGLKPWVLVIGALVMALLAFAITRAALG